MSSSISILIHLCSWSLTYALIYILNDTVSCNNSLGVLYSCLTYFPTFVVKSNCNITLAGVWGLRWLRFEGRVGFAYDNKPIRFSEYVNAALLGNDYMFNT